MNSVGDEALTGIYSVIIIRAVLTPRHTGKFPGAPRAYGSHANLCMLCTACFLMFKH